MSLVRRVTKSTHLVKQFWAALMLISLARLVVEGMPMPVLLRPNGPLAPPLEEVPKLGGNEGPLRLDLVGATASDPSSLVSVKVGESRRA